MLGYSENRILRLQAEEGGCPFVIDTEIVEVTNPVTGRTWMDRNIGASRAATSISDSAAYGGLFQFGRTPDGHEDPTSEITSILSETACPGHSDFIIAPYSPRAWDKPINPELWQDSLDGIWRVPTYDEWEAERLSWSRNSLTGAYNSVLKLPGAGLRNYKTGAVSGVGGYGFYWTSSFQQPTSPHSPGGLRLTSSDATIYYYYRAQGLSLRLIKDL